MKSKSKNNKAQKNPRVNGETLATALRTIKARGNADDIKTMREIQEVYATGLQFALGLSWDTFVNRFRDPRTMTLEDILNTADISELDPMKLAEIAINEAMKNHIKRDISDLLPEE